MKAYLRFRMPYPLSHEFREIVEHLFPAVDLPLTKHHADFHVTLAYFGTIVPEHVTGMNTAIDAVALRYRNVKTRIKLCGFDVFETKKGALLVALAEVEPFKTWQLCRYELLHQAKHFAADANQDPWNPHVALGLFRNTANRNVDRDIPTRFSWQAEKVELVLKTHIVPLNIPAWNIL